ncbi:hypothetical protein H8958_003020, partial [Nasalis larvatus]
MRESRPGASRSPPLPRPRRPAPRRQRTPGRYGPPLRLAPPV